MAWLSGWAKRVKLTIDQNDIDATLENFPILIHISTSSGREPDDVSFVFDELTSDDNRKKIAITTSDGETQCYVEIEKWNDVNEKAWLWVKIPAIASNTDTDLYLYYDITHADNTDYVGDPSDAVVHNVWDANFKLVSHMRDDPDNQHIRDSTVNAIDGTKAAAGAPAVTTSGKIDDAQDFDGQDDYIDHGDTDAGITTLATLEAWVNSDLNHNGGIISNDITYTSKKGFDFFVWTGVLYIDFGNGTTCYRVSNALSNTVWHHVVGLLDGDFVRLFIDGASVGTPVAWSGSYSDPAKNTWLGKINATTAYMFNGKIDEVRVSHTNRNAAWIKATYETGRDHLLDFGSEELAPSAYYHGLKVQGIGELALCDIGTHPLRIRKGGTTYGIELVAIDDPNASALRIKTPSGIKAIRKYT